MQKKITYMVMGVAVGIILIGSVFAMGKSGAVNATDERTLQETTAAGAKASDKPEITNLLYVTDRANEPATPITERPEQEEIEMLAKLIWGEARGVESTTEKAAVAWCVLNRVDSKGYPNTIEGVITQPHQFVGYGEDYPATEEHKALAEDVLCRWYAEKAGESNTGRVLPKEYIYFTGDGQRNHFTSEWKSDTVWDWSLKSPYYNTFRQSIQDVSRKIREMSEHQTSTVKTRCLHYKSITQVTPYSSHRLPLYRLPLYRLPYNNARFSRENKKLYYFEKAIDFLCGHKYNKCAYKKRGDEMAKRTGRPPSDNPKTERLFIRVTPSEKAEIQEHSKKTGFSLLDLIRKGIEATKK